MIDLSQMLPQQRAAGPQMPPPRYDSTNSTDKEPNAVTEAMKGGGSKLEESAPVGTMGADMTKGFAQAQQTLDKLPTKLVEPVPADTGSDEWLAGGGCSIPSDNVSSNESGKVSGFPDAAGGPGTGRQPKSVIGTTLAKPRSTFNPAYMKGAK